MSKKNIFKVFFVVLYLILMTYLLGFHSYLMVNFYKLFGIQLMVCILFSIVAIKIKANKMEQYQLVFIGYLISYLCYYMPFIVKEPLRFFYYMFVPFDISEIIVQLLIPSLLGGHIFLTLVYWVLGKFFNYIDHKLNALKLNKESLRSNNVKSTFIMYTISNDFKRTSKNSDW